MTRKEGVFQLGQPASGSAETTCLQADQYSQTQLTGGPCFACSSRDELQLVSVEYDHESYLDDLGAVVASASDQIEVVPASIAYWLDGTRYEHEVLAQLDQEYLVETEIMFIDDEIVEGKFFYNESFYDTLADAMSAARAYILKNVPLLVSAKPVVYMYNGTPYRTLEEAQACIQAIVWKSFSRSHPARRINT